MSSLPPFHPLAASDSQTLYAAVDGRMAPLGAGEAVFFEAENGRSHVMTQQVAQAYGLCRSFQTLDEHIARIMQAMPALKGQAEAVRKVLEMLRSRGLLRSDMQFVERFLPEAASAQAEVAGIFVMASDHAAALGSCLDALGEQALRHPLPGPVFVLDPAGRAEAGAIARLRAQAGVAVAHVTSAQLAPLCDALIAQAGLDAAQAAHLRWLLDGSGRGAMRNWIALLAAGRRAVLLDAETALPLLRHPDFTPGLYVDDRAYAVRSFDSRNAHEQAGQALQADVLGAHLDVCGLSLAEAMARQPQAALQRVSLHGVDVIQAPWLRPDAHVAVTTVGRHGDFALSDPCLPYRLDAAARAGLTATREGYLKYHRSPLLWRAARNFQTGMWERFTPLALDVSRLLPCTLPSAPFAGDLQLALLRLSDAGLTDFGFPDALRQTWPGEAADDALGRPDSAQCLIGLAGHVAQDLYASDAAARLAVMAAKLGDLAAAEDAVLRNYLVEYLAYHRASAIEHMQQLAAAAKSPPVYWLADLRSSIEAQGKALIAGEAPRLAGWPENDPEATHVARFRSELSALAAGLKLWPSLFAQARQRAAAWCAQLTG